MIARDPQLQWLYNARLKYELDGAAKLDYARQEGLEQGLQQGIEQGIEQGKSLGKQNGEIHLLQQLLGDSLSAEAELERLPPGELAAMSEDLRRRLRERGLPS